jgi:predicted nucleotidyltransferase
MTLHHGTATSIGSGARAMAPAPLQQLTQVWSLERPVFHFVPAQVSALSRFLPPPLDFPRTSPDFLGMRLTAEQKRTIREQVDGFLGGGAELSVYGSRLNDDARGGDIDLLVRTAQPVDMLDQARLHARLEEALQLPVDLLFVAEGAETTHFKRMICAQAQPLAA